MNYLFGVDIGGTTIKIGVLDYFGNILNKNEIKTNKENSGDNILKDVANYILSYSKDNNISFSQIKGVGFGVPGPVIDNLVSVCVNLGWVNKNVKEEFSKLIPFETKICVANDANVAAIGEMYKGNKFSYNNAILLTLGTGVGGGVVVGSKAIDGFNGAGGELGHVKVDFKYNFKCNCGLEGCLETVASATGVVNIAKYYLLNEKSILSNIENFTCKDVFDNIDCDDVSKKVVEEVCKYLGYVCSILAVTTNPEVFIIGGGLSKVGDVLVESVKKYYKQYAFPPVKNTNIILASLGNDAGMIGAALIAK